MDVYTRIPGLMAASYRASALVLVVVTRCGYAQSLSAFTPTQAHHALFLKHDHRGLVLYLTNEKHRFQDLPSFFWRRNLQKYILVLRDDEIGEEI